MARLPPPTRESAPEDQRSVFDELTKASGAARLSGPGSILLHVPKLRWWEKGLNDCLRHESSLTKKTQELAMLVTARELDCQYIWSSHAPAAREAGVSALLVDALRERKELPPLPADETAVVQYGREIFRNHHVSRGAFQAALAQFGQRGIVELGMIFGTYSSLCCILNAFDADLPAKAAEPVLPIEPGT